VPQAWFSHFYALGAAVNAALLCLVLSDGRAVDQQVRVCGRVACERCVCVCVHKSSRDISKGTPHCCRQPPNR
jgi:hypothetical protein